MELRHLIFRDFKRPPFIFYCLFVFLIIISVSVRVTALDGSNTHLETSQWWLSQAHPDALRVLKFWFEEWDRDIERGGIGRYNEKWFPHGPAGVRGSRDVDQASREQFLELFKSVTAGQHRWNIEENPFDNLAYIILTDQLSRNMFRGSASAYKHDALGRAAVDLNLKGKLYEHYFTGYQKLFVVFPLMHHENLDSQQRSIEYLKMLNESEQEPYAFLKALEKGFQHYQIIHMFGRFPHRNALLGRENTELENEYLRRQDDVGFINGGKW